MARRPRHPILTDCSTNDRFFSMNGEALYLNFWRWSMRNAFVSNIYEKNIVVRFINIEEHYLITNPEFFGK
ncbi:hypothetical protein [Dapis sp. BLCC M229]|uniref:hypothetical protein n=1 Tax=Dapis sp. BLCC M229 TaxID=3400188 RepID=UPI003CF45B44